MKKFGPNDRLRDARYRKHLSQAQLAELIGTGEKTVGRWERGETLPDAAWREKLCAFFQMTPEELGFPPAPVTAIYDPTIPPPPSIPLIGRANELATLRQRLRSGGNVALTTVHGLPGVGKTALAITLAHDEEIREHFRNGILWAGLGPYPNISGILSRWGALLGVAPTERNPLSDRAAWARAIHTAIGTRRLLLIIDDAWNRDEALTLKVGGPNCAHLITTRFPQIAADITFDNPISISELDTDESMTLLRLLAPGVVEGEGTGVFTLIQAVGGLPLALTLMGNYLRKQSSGGRRIHTAMRRLSDARERLHISEPYNPTAPNPSLSSDMALSLQSVIAVTDQQLAPPARSALYALSVFPAKPNSFSEEAALAIADCPADTLDVLADTGLLENSGPDRYTLHQTIADYARMHLTDETAYERLVAYGISYMQAHEKDYELLERESAVLLAALETAYQRGMRAELVHGACSLAPFLLLRGAYSLAEHHMQRAHEAALQQNDTQSITSTLLYLGEIALRQSDYTRAEALFQQGLTLARQSGNRERICGLLSELGWLAWKRGAYSQAETYLQEGLTLARQDNYYEHLGNLLKTLGTLATSRGAYAQSETYLQESLLLARQSGDREKISNQLLNLGVNQGNQGHYDRAETYLLEGLALARQIGHRERISIFLLNLGTLAYEQANYQRAEAYLLEGLSLVRQLDHREWISAYLINIGEMLQKQGHYIRAEPYLREALERAKALGSLRIIASALFEYGNLQLNRHQIAEASAIFHEMLNSIPEGDQEMLALAHYGQARVAAAQHNIAEARRIGETCATLLESIGHHKAVEVRQWLASLASD